MQSATERYQRLLEPVADRLERLAGADAVLGARLSHIGAIASEMKRGMSRLGNAARQMEAHADRSIDSGGLRRDVDFDALELDRYSKLNELCRDLNECSRDLEALRSQLALACDDLLTPMARRTFDLRRLRRRLHGLRQVDLLAMLSQQLDAARRDGVAPCFSVRHESSEKLEVDRALATRLLERLRACGEVLLATAQAVVPEQAAGLTVQVHVQALPTRVRLRLQAPLLADSAANLRLLRQLSGPVHGGRGELPEDAGEQRHAVLESAWRRLTSEVANEGGRLLLQAPDVGGLEACLELPARGFDAPVLFVAAGERVFGVLMTQVRAVRRVADLESAEDGIVVDHQSRPWLDLVNLVQPRVDAHGATTCRSPATGAYVLLIEHEGRTWAIGVDRLLPNRYARLVSLAGPIGLDLGVVAGAVLDVEPDASARHELRGEAGAAQACPWALVLDLEELLRRHVREVSNLRLQEAPESVDDMDAARRNVSRVQPALALVVDDSVTIRKVTERLLTQNGYRVVTARDGRDALDRLDHELPDIVLLDIEMPRMDGFQFAEAVRRDPKLTRLPIVMISSRSGEKHRQQAARLGIDAFLGKPFDEVGLLGTMTRLLEESR
ncbi:MAG: response regulator [Gammaproteobacteria bacterium]|nr:response regulator [Gammaproteobacteria bacterium]